MKTKNHKTLNTQLANEQTFLEHLKELRGRLFWVVGFGLLASAAAYPFQQQILGALLAPLGNQHLYYLSPAGGFSFILKVCTYVGVAAAIPVAFYHLYKYLEPLMSGAKKSLARYVGLSLVLAVAGVGFAYLVSLPAALHFLSTIGQGQVEAMLTADAYLSFVMSYLLGAALLFQLPLILLIINTIKPLTPRRLMGAQRYVVVAAFIIAAVISPTPDIINQAILAVPIVAMYQLGVVLVWLQSRKQLQSTAAQAQAMPAALRMPVAQINIEQPVKTVKPVLVDNFVARRQPITKVSSPSRQVIRSIDGMSLLAT